MYSNWLSMVPEFREFCEVESWAFSPIKEPEIKNMVKMVFFIKAFFSG
jgi:hypothetical protein